MPIQLNPTDEELAAQLAAQLPYVEDDAECLIVDLVQERDTSWASPERTLAAAIHNDRFWSILLAARAQRKAP